MQAMYFIRHRFKWKYLIFGFILFLIFEYVGFFRHLSEVSFNSYFTYPYDGDIKGFVADVRKGNTPKVAPINVLNYKYLASADQKCRVGDKIRLVYIVKSAAHHFDRRQAIRSSWGFEKRFSDINIRTVYIVGVVEDPEVLLTILHEREIYQDIVQVDFVDSYYNNTIKTISGMKWAITYCPEADYYFFSDDDMYVSTKNVLRFVRNPVEYPKNLQVNLVNDGSQAKHLHNFYNSDLPSNALLYSGYVFQTSPIRNKLSKWYVSLDEYPYDEYPVYVTAGSYVLSKEALHVLYYSTLYTKLYRFDDVYLGFVAQKAGIEPLHSEHFYFEHKPYSVHDYQYVIASHGFENPKFLFKIWNEQKSAGNA